jgi:hypothetical protein
LSFAAKPALMNCEEDEKLITKLEEENHWLRKKVYNSAWFIIHVIV